MKSFLHNLSRVAMLDLADALAAGRLKPPYSSLRVAGYVPEPMADDIAADFVRMSAAGMQPAHIAQSLELLASKREANQQTQDRVQLVWTGPDVPGSVSRDTGVVVLDAPPPWFGPMAMSAVSFASVAHGWPAGITIWMAS
jgi:hypothetical protein